MSQALAMFRMVGPEKFSQTVCQMAPYFSSIQPTLLALEPGRADATVPFRREIDHQPPRRGTRDRDVQPSELVAGLMTDVSAPQGARWIPTGMTVRHKAKAKGDITARADASGIDWTIAGDKLMPMEAVDTNGVSVFSASITMNVKLAA